MRGEVISHFEILETLGEGGMGVVYKARDTKLDRIVAVKLLPRSLMRSDADRERFSLEARAAGNLSHPNICTVFEYDEVDGQALIAMECIEGPSLSDRLSEGRFTLDEALAVTKQVAAGLAAAHAKGIVHRDIKPGNVLMTENGVVKISDFGLAKLVGGAAMTQTGFSIGTVAYMSPEQTRGESVGPETDVWALGVVLYEMLRGDRPFAHDYPTATMYAIVHEEPRNMDRLDAEFGSDVSSLVRRCLAKDPAERPTASDIVDMLVGSATSSRTVIQPVEQRKLRTKAVPWKVILAALGVVALLLVGLLVYPVDQEFTPDVGGAHIAIFPVELPGVTDGATSMPDSSLKLTLDGLLQTVSTAIDGALRSRGGVGVVPFRDMVEMGVSTPDGAVGKLGADYAITSRVEGYDPVPTVAFALIHEGSRQVGDAVSVPILLSDLQESYEAVLVRLGRMLGIPDSVFAGPSEDFKSTTSDVFQLYTRGMGLLQQRASVRSLEAAEDHLQRAIERDPNFAAGHAALGKAALYKFEATKELDLLEVAERHCDAALALQPDLTDAYVTLAAVHSYTGKPGQAQRAIETALAKQPFNMDALLVLADIQVKQQRFVLAEQTYKRAIASNPDYWGGYSRLGRFYYERSQWELAAEQYQKVVDLAPMNSIGYRNLGSMMWFAGDLQEAKRNWELSIQIEPAYSTYNNMGTMYFYEADYPAAAAAYEKALEINEQDHRVWSNLSTAYYWMGADRRKYQNARQKAAEMAERWLEVNPSDLTVKSELAAYYADLGRLEKSRVLLQEFGSEPANELSSHISFQIGATWELLGERDKALMWIRDALEKGYGMSEIARYPGLEEFWSDTASVRIIDSLQVDRSAS